MHGHLRTQRRYHPLKGLWPGPSANGLPLPWGALPIGILQAVSSLKREEHWLGFVFKWCVAIFLGHVHRDINNKQTPGWAHFSELAFLGVTLIPPHCGNFTEGAWKSQTSENGSADRGFIASASQVCVLLFQDRGKNSGPVYFSIIIHISTRVLLSKRARVTGSA